MMMMMMRMTGLPTSKSSHTFLLAIAFAALYVMVDSRPHLSAESPPSRVRRVCKMLTENATGARKKKFDDLRYSYEERREATMKGWAPRECPKFTVEYLQRQNKHGMRSISPYGPILDYNPFRRPRVIIHQACLCQYCFNTETMMTNFNLASHNITTAINVLYSNGTLGTYNVITGCTCVVPKTHVSV